MASSVRLKRWMVLVGLAGFVAGIPVGVALHQTWRDPLAEDSAWMRRFQEQYALAPVQRQQIRRVLVVRDREILAVYTSLGGNIPDELRDKIIDIRRRADERIQAALDTTQREQYMKDRRRAQSVSSK